MAKDLRIEKMNDMLVESEKAKAKLVQTSQRDISSKDLELSVLKQNLDKKEMHLSNAKRSLEEAQQRETSLDTQLGPYVGKRRVGKKQNIVHSKHLTIQHVTSRILKIPHGLPLDGPRSNTKVTLSFDGGFCKPGPLSRGLPGGQ